jgi:hypothetical protein
MLAPFHGAATPEQVESLNLGRVLFLVSSFVAPIEILLVGSFTVYDPPPAIFWSALVFVAFALLSTLRAVRPDQSLTQVLQYLFILFVQLPVIIFFVRSRFMIHASLCAFILGTLVGIGDAYLDPQALERIVWVTPRSTCRRSCSISSSTAGARSADACPRCSAAVASATCCSGRWQLRARAALQRVRSLASRSSWRFAAASPSGPRLSRAALPPSWSWARARS